ncbi:MAG: TraM recognition domain-containing protein [Alphaproteobacteria bacterium]|nr:TraM recognition domain-containing protein [Alphaproteobacteria bacterium]MBV8406874.1 TraM recognition domain-containing protein [Alphaproteobacteria bacterium]
MERVSEHLRIAVARCLADGAKNAAELLMDSFRVERPPQEHRQSFRLPFPPALILRGADWLLRNQGFDVGKGIDAERGMIAGRLERDLGGSAWIAALGSPRRDWRLSFTVELHIAEDEAVHLATSRLLPGWIAEFRERLEAHLRKSYQPAVEHGRTVHEALAGPGAASAWPETVLGPGEMLRRPFRGTLRDYSGCATEQQTRDLRAECGGVLPLGRQVFDRGDGQVEKGPLLRLSPNRNTGALREHQGTLICAPQNSGKTELLVRWAKAANKAGYNLFLVDVKGNLLRRLNRDGALQGEVYHFTTDPECRPGGTAPCHALNFLERLDPWSRLGIQRIRQLAEAVLPTDGLEQGEVKLFRQNWVNWLTTFIHLVLLDEHYTPFVERRADLSDVCQLASDENALMDCLRRIAVAELMELAEGREPPQPRLSDLFGEISVLLPQMEIVPEFADTQSLWGRRSEHSYRWLTETLVGLLRAFRSYGPLGDKISGANGLPRFSLEWVAGLDDALRPSQRQVTVILAAREQDGDDSRTILTLAIARLQQALLERMRHTGDRTMRPVLLLLDETRRIRNFRTNEYVSFAREAEAGCVVVYQSLDQVGDERQIAELLENIGTQIYLGSLVRNTARHLVASLPKRHRPTFTLSSGGADGMGGVQIGQETIDFFSTADLYVLPAGSFPALVQINDQPRRRPILVSLDRAHGEREA